MSVTDTLTARFPGAIHGTHANYGDETILVDRAHLPEVLKFLKENPECPFDLLLDLCGVDYPGRDPRFEVVYHLYSLSKKWRLRIKTGVPESDLQVPSVMDIWETADWFERELYDMFGIRVTGHPKLERILMWDQFEGHPLRKDYPVAKRQPIPTPKELLME